MSPALAGGFFITEPPRMCLHLAFFIYMKVKVLVAQLCPTPSKLMDCSLPDSSVPWNSPKSGNEHRSSALQADSLQTEPPRILESKFHAKLDSLYQRVLATPIKIGGGGTKLDDVCPHYHWY